ncbi:SDR family oxidoreductase [Virgisporangium aliadipatigenens]|uniref:SDR family oxidoreductase n=1 Tax=Virgisporangium aliadipatigenens TaxID=741659 RepID=UPI001943B06B|nr:sugar nucleotide-binding protein [Virgisporangium aliadipatigenens]
MDVLVVGGSGLLGRALVRRAARSGARVAATYHRHAPSRDGRPLDIRRRDDVVATLRRIRPAAVVNAAFDQGDWATTADGAAHVAIAAVDVGARLVHVSSDAVFSGRSGRYTERDRPCPGTPYGAAKAAAETAVAAIDPDAAVARTSLIIGGGESAHETFAHALVAGTASGVLFTDDVRCPVHVDDLADALLELAGSAHPGTYHVAGPEAVSRHELGTLITGRALPAGLRVDSGLPGARDVRLDCAWTRARLGTRPRGVREFLSR